MVSYWSLSDSKSPQVSRTLLNILADLNNVVWMVSTRPLISKSSSPCINPLVTVPRAPITIGITVTFMFYSLSIPYQGPGTYPSFRFLSNLICGQLGLQSSQLFKSFFFFFFFLVIIIRSGHLVDTRWSICISKLLRRFWVSFPKTVSGFILIFVGYLMPNPFLYK